MRGKNPMVTSKLKKFTMPTMTTTPTMTTVLKRHVQDIGHAQSTQPNYPMKFFTGSMGHVCLSMCIEPPRTYIRY